LAAFKSSDEQRLDEFFRGKARELGRPFAQRRQPFGDRLCPPQARVVEIIAPAKRCREPLAKPSLEAERRQLHPVDGRDKRLFLAFRDDGLGLRQACEGGPIKQVGSRSKHVRSS